MKIFDTNDKRVANFAILSEVLKEIKKFYNEFERSVESMVRMTYKQIKLF
jgi:hypothetical protein